MVGMTIRLYRTERLRRIEQEAARALAPGTLMARAGAAAAAFVERRCSGAAPVLFVCGPGNNGGDGYEAAWHLQRRGRPVLCVALGAPAADDARAAHQRYMGAGGAVVPEIPQSGPWSVAVDAMFGIGLTRPLAGPYLAAAHWMSRQQAPVIALDVPSGLDADTGAWVGAVPGVHATATITFIGAKPGLFTHEGCDAAGRVEVADLEVAAGASTGALNGPDCFEALVQPRRRNSHKGSFGDVLVVGGATGMVGATLLAARGALRLGAGRVYVDCIGAPDMLLDPAQPELMFRPAASLTAADVVVVGCGAGRGQEAQAALAQSLRRHCPVVADADALNLIASDPELRRALAERGAAHTSVLTPHPLEAARLLGSAASAVQADRIGAATALAASFNGWTVLKGAGSVIAAPDGRYWINPTGSPALASPGTGDVLAGMIGALLAQGFPAEDAVLGAVWLHGAAADAHGADSGLVASDLPALAARRLAALRARPADCSDP
jgi:hydroxyethylthiazole kinase-like uncharacterized protein yjeF